MVTVFDHIRFGFITYKIYKIKCVSFTCLVYEANNMIYDQNLPLIYFVYMSFIISCLTHNQMVVKYIRILIF